MNERKLIKEILGVIFIFLAVFILWSLLTYTPGDLKFNTSSPNIPVKNAGGVVGAHICFGILFFLGFSAYSLPVILFVMGIFLLKNIEALKIGTKFIYAAFILFVLSSLFSTVDLFSETLIKELNIISRGGAFGQYVDKKLFSPYVGKGGSILILSGMFLVLFSLFTELSVSKISHFVFSKGMQLLKGINSFFSAFAKFVQGAGKQIFSLMERIREKKGFPAEKGIRRFQGKEDASSYLGKTAVKVPERIEPEKEKSQEKKITLFENRAEKEAALSEKQSAEKQKKMIAPASKSVKHGVTLPPLTLLEDHTLRQDKNGADDEKLLVKSAEILESTFSDFGISVKVINIQKGPTITRFELSIAPGTKLQKITALSNNIALAMKAISVRILAPIPGKSAIGIEIPNLKKSLVSLKEMLESKEFLEGRNIIPLAFGIDVSGAHTVVDLVDMPHLLIAGATGSGKSVCINAIICTLLYAATPEEIRFVLIDPKKVELACYAGIPHLYCPIINTSHKASLGLRLLIKEMEKRYEIFAKLGVRNIKAYREHQKKIAEKVLAEKAPAENEPAETLENLPYIVIIIDELADLILVSSSDVQDSVIRLAQLSRAVGIHLVLATQRPSVDVVTGLIKANFPCRISFKLPSRVDSRTVLDADGADKLLGDGDMLFLPPATSKLQRVQGTYVSDAEIKRIVGFLKEQEEVQYNDEMTKKMLSASESDEEGDEDELFDESVSIIMESKLASASMLQRRLKIGYNRATRIIELMEKKGIIGPHMGSKGREIYIESSEELENNDNEDDNG